MIAADSSTWVAFLEAQPGEDVDLMVDALLHHELRMVPAVLTELLSSPGLPQDTAVELRSMPRVVLHAGYWENAGMLRAKILARGRRARLGDALIAESCLAENIRLLTRDRDFRIFAEAAGLQLALFPE